MPTDKSDSARPEFTRRALIAAAIVAAITVALLVGWYAARILLILFAGILLAILLRTLSDWVSRHTRLRAVPSLAVVVVTLFAILAGAVWWQGPILAEQVGELQRQLPGAAAQLRDRIAETGLGKRLLEVLPSVQTSGGQQQVLRQATSVFSQTLAFVGGLLFVGFLGLFLAADPDLYTNGLVRLLPQTRRARARDVLRQVGKTLRWWLLSRAVTMVLVGILTGVGLALLGVPLAFTFGLLAALLDFIPNFGPIIAAVPAILLATVESPQLGLYTAALYIVVQALEAWVITPLVEREAVSLPPALTLSVQVLLTLMLGLLGAALASPLVAAAIVFVRTTYIEDVLGDNARTAER